MVWTGTTLITGSSRSTVWEVNFGTFGGGFLLGFGFLEPRRLGRSSRFTELEMVFLFPVWEEGFWTTAVVVSWTWTSSSPLVTAFSLFSFIVAIPMTKKTNLGLKKKKKSGRHLLRRVVSSCTRFSEVGIGPSPQAARRLKVTRPWKDLLEKERTRSIRSK